MKKYAFINRGFNLRYLSHFLITLGVVLLVFFNIETAQAQDIEITLTWTGTGTILRWVDLWVTDPNGNIYTWDNYDGINGISPDIYTADAGTAINGKYLVEVCYWSAPEEPPDPVEATVVITSRKGTINEKSTTYGPHTITDTDLADSDHPEHTYPDAWWTVTTFSWPPLTGGGGASGSEACFIATAAYSSHELRVTSDEKSPLPVTRLPRSSPKAMVWGYPLPNHPITVLQRFRDEYLLTNTPGRALVSFYNRVSPGVADFIRDKEPLKAIVRFYLKPVVWLAEKVTLNNEH
jgi:hypothetical protein